MRPFLLAGLGALVACLAACGGTASSGFGNGGHGGGGSSGGGGGTGGGGGGQPPPLENDSGTNPGNTDCTVAAMLVYVIDQGGVLHSFDPGSLTFTTIGLTNCPGAMGTNSMAVDRSATAWVNDVNGRLYKVDTSTASCTPTSFVPGQHGFGNQFGMGFSADVAGGSAETLFIDGIGGFGLATIDLATLTLSPVGKFGGGLGADDCELTGTGDGRLYGFFTNHPASVAQIDKTTAGIISNAQQAGVDTGTDWAFSFWGGSFYLYTANTAVNPLDTTNVTQYDPMTSTTKVVLAQIGFRIVGAGVSTCAPTKPPPVK